MREDVKQKVHCSGSIRFLQEKEDFGNSGGTEVRLEEPGL